MLTLHSASSFSDCSGLSRRNFLRAGTLALGNGGITTSGSTLALRTHAASEVLVSIATVFMY